MNRDFTLNSWSQARSKIRYRNVDLTFPLSLRYSYQGSRSVASTTIVEQRQPCLRKKTETAWTHRRAKESTLLYSLHMPPLSLSHALSTDPSRQSFLAIQVNKLVRRIQISRALPKRGRNRSRVVPPCRWRDPWDKTMHLYRYMYARIDSFGSDHMFANAVA